MNDWRFVRIYQQFEPSNGTFSRHRPEQTERRLNHRRFYQCQPATP
ncbi:hypothetical protein RESH_00560 [Rhodopirellula europaea SH398]|uniref:Uncharacterized protein n=1 Tax=Rhodopirellula europaea SH398 TaxID=1263868 RepID=M5SBQ3_9BACT|nr:hypothetical protein RESH_00560 [Rhodopirellula europaea SH398]